MNQPIHILNQMGVLTSFSVAKKITEEDIHKFFAKQKKSGKKEGQIGKLLKDKIVSDIQEAIANNSIPGLVTPQELAESMGFQKEVVEKIPELNRLLVIISTKLMEKNYDKMSLCYFVNSLVNMLGLTEDDFTNFHKKNNSEEEEGDDDEGDGDTI